MPDNNITDNPAYTKSLNELIGQFSKLPGIGSKTAERLAFYILKSQATEALLLAEAITNVKTQIRQCSVCFNLAEAEICPICADKSRDNSIICVVEQPKDVISLEKTGLCRWKYHILGGHIAPLEGFEPDDLTIKELIKRVRTEPIKELVMATNPTIEGDGTAIYITSLLRNSPIRITRLARGLPAGSNIEFVSSPILTDAILGRNDME